MNKWELKPDQLFRKCHLDDLPFTSTDDFEEETGSISVIFQPRAEESLHFGVGIKRKGYNIFAFGDQGTGKHSFITGFLEQRAIQEPVPEDICYVANFQQSHAPRLLKMKPGFGIKFSEDMKHLVEDVRNAMQAAFEKEEYQNRAQSILKEFEEKQQKVFEELKRKAREKNLVVMPTPGGLAFVPAKEGTEESISKEEYGKLTDEEKQRLKESAEEMEREAQRIGQNFPQWQREVREKQKSFNKEITQYSVDPLINELKEKYAGQETVTNYLQAVRDDLIQNIKELLSMPQGQGGMPQSPQMLQSQNPMAGPMENPVEKRYRINVLVDHGESQAAPVVYEENPTFQKLFGRIEHLAQLGTLITDFNMIRPGAMHRANGGYLILDALKLLQEPFAWEGLKRVLRSGKLKIESIYQMYSLISTVSLEPEALPIDVKVVLVGSPFLYYLIKSRDPGFSRLFKVPADFAAEMDRDPQNEHEFARLIAGIVRRESLLPLKHGAVERVIEQGSRLSMDAQKISLQLDGIANLLREADYWARQNGRSVVETQHVEKAVNARIYRSDRLRERMQEQIERDIFLIDTDGKRVGQVNGLSVISLGDIFFGRPSRITAQIRLGKGDVLDIEREVAMGGPIHSKGVLILSGFLGGRYALETPMSLSASLVFEQSYGGVEGDSASSAELYALLSAIADVPIRQDCAVTGSVNQYGQIQPIGGVNEKIEGFFDICQTKGLTGNQGVLIPLANVQHLMLKKEVVDAVKSGTFHVHAINTVDQGIEILTGLSAGQPDEKGHYPKDTFNFKVQQRLEQFSEKRRQFAKDASDMKEEHMIKEQI